METPTRIQPLLIPAFAMALLILIGLVTLRKPDFPYALSVEETHAAVMDTPDELDPSQAMELLAGMSGPFQFIDLRNEYEFNTGHVQGAIQIPVHALLHEEHFGKLQAMDDEGIKLVLYGSTLQQANGAWMVLKQLGFRHVVLLRGGYPALLAEEDSLSSTVPFPGDEDARFDFAAIMEEAGAGKAEPQPALETPERRPEAIVPTQRPRKSAVEGGC